MTRDNIEDYLYFFWAPLLQANAVSSEDIDDLQKMIILTLSQASVYIEAPAYALHSGSREYTDEIKNAVAGFANKIFISIPERTTEDSYWLNISVGELLPEINSSTTHLRPERSFGPYKTAGDKLFVFDFYYIANQLQLQLHNTSEISAILSTNGQEWHIPTVHRLIKAIVRPTKIKMKYQ